MVMAILLKQNPKRQHQQTINQKKTLKKRKTGLHQRKEKERDLENENATVPGRDAGPVHDLVENAHDPAGGRVPGIERDLVPETEKDQGHEIAKDLGPGIAKGLDLGTENGLGREIRSDLVHETANVPDRAVVAPRAVPIGTRKRLTTESQETTRLIFPL